MSGRAQFEALEAVAVAMLEPLFDAERAGEAARPGAVPAWRAPLAAAAERCAATASALGLGGFAPLAGLAARGLRAAAAERPTLDDAQDWIAEAIAFCSGQVPAAQAGVLVERLRQWPGLAERLTAPVVEALVARLAADAGRLAAPMADGPTVASDELALLADAVRQLDEALRPALRRFAAAPDSPAEAAALREALAFAAEDLERVAEALDLLGLPPLGALARALRGNFERLAVPGEPLAGPRLRLLDGVAEAWLGALERPSSGTAGALAAFASDGGWPQPAPPELGRACADALERVRVVATRQVEAPADEAADEDFPLAIPDRADPEVVEQLLQELAPMAAEFARCVEALRAGSQAELERAQRIAHTLKGSANTVGVRGVARLTHRLEDVLQLLARPGTALPPALGELLGEAADCLADMSDAVAGLAQPPAGVGALHRRLGEWVARLLEAPAAGRAGAGGGASAGMEAGAGAPEGAVDRASAARVAGAGAATAPSQPPRPEEAAEAPEPEAEAGAQGPLRVAASEVARLLELASQASIALSQASEQLAQLERTAQAAGLAGDHLQDLARELDDSVDARPAAPAAGAGGEGVPPSGLDALELDEYDELHGLARRVDEASADARLLARQLARQVSSLRDALAGMERAQAEMHEAALAMRTVRFDSAAPRLERVVRQAARMSGKPAALSIDGGEARVDSGVLAALVPAIAHLLRNAVDHGIEDAPARERAGKPRLGRVALRVRRDATSLEIACADDGAGLDLDAIRARAVELGLAAPGEPFGPADAARVVSARGFSTRAGATELSGRGIGLDAAVVAVRGLRGSVALGSEPGRGTTVTIRVPLASATMPVSIVRSRRHLLALSVRGLERIAAADALSVDARGGRFFDAGGERLAVRALDEALGLPEGVFDPLPGDPPAALRVAVVRLDDGSRLALLLPEPEQARSVAVRALGRWVPPVPGCQGAAVLGDGAVAPVFDLPALLGTRTAADDRRLAHGQRGAPVCLVADDSVSVRRAMEIFLADLGFEVDSAADGTEALARIARRVPDLAIVDLEMPGMNGLDLAEALRADGRTRDLPLIMITSRASERHRQLALEAGVDLFLTKPYDEDELAARIVALMRGRRGSDSMKPQGRQAGAPGRIENTGAT